jgi:hypothetical protein
MLMGRNEAFSRILIDKAIKAKTRRPQAMLSEDSR